VLFNGPIECRLLSFPLLEGSARRAAPSATPPTASTAGELDASAFANRLRKRVRHLQRWAAREGVTCYRVYDADLPEFALAVDRYEQWVHVQEYAPPAAVDPARARARLRAALGIIAEVLELPASHVFLKVRQRQRGRSQYERLRERGELTEVGEGGHRFLVNFTDYLDTGLFLDHRLTRARLADLAQGRDFLNLFAYTGTATVYAAKGGARSTTSVDLSRTYLDWAQRNLELNGIGGPRHRLERADCLSWLERAPGRYGLVFLDPPTFSTSKAMAGTFDVQRDHARVLQRVARLLTADGVLLFSTNHQRFRLDRAALAGLDVDDITTATLPPDFRRSPRIHRAFLIRRASL
jgi:23S rRNA (guanine2445-N2)-methyltransferase / 23S rRNA (guanine2069-N7)-methyltransferase